MARSARAAKLGAVLDREWKAIDWPDHTDDATVRERRIRFTDIGTGPAVILIHGQGGSWQWWLRVLPGLSEHARAIAVDLPGFGGSDPVAAGDVFDEHVATVVGLLDHLDVPDAVVVGHSMGGLVALRVAAEHPDRLSGLVLTNAGGAELSPLRLRIILAGLKFFAQVMERPATSRWLARTSWARSALMAGAIHDPDCVTTDLALQLLPQMASPGYVATLRAAAGALNDVRPRDVECPALVVWGVRDRILPLSVGVELSRVIPRATLVTLADVAHCPMIEAPNRLTDLLVSFVGDPAGGRSDSLSLVPARIPGAAWIPRFRRWAKRAG